MFAAWFPSSPLGSMINEIERAFDAGLYHSALLMALTLPEICAALTLNDSAFVREPQYVAFIEKHVPVDGLGVTPQQCYRLRCGVVHRGNAAGHPFFGTTHVIFTVPESQTKFYGGRLDAKGHGKQAHLIDLGRFIRTMTAAVTDWYEDNQGDPKVIENMPRLLSWRPNGVWPFLVGQPVIASGV